MTAIEGNRTGALSAAPVYRRVLLKLSGNAFSPPDQEFGISEPALMVLARQLQERAQAKARRQAKPDQARRAIGLEQLEARWLLVPVIADHPQSERRAARGRERHVDDGVLDRDELPAARRRELAGECARLLREEGPRC